MPTLGKMPPSLDRPSATRLDTPVWPVRPMTCWTTTLRPLATTAARAAAPWVDLPGHHRQRQYRPAFVLDRHRGGLILDRANHPGLPWCGTPDLLCLCRVEHGTGHGAANGGKRDMAGDLE